MGGILLPNLIIVVAMLLEARRNGDVHPVYRWGLPISIGVEAGVILITPMPAGGLLSLSLAWLGVVLSPLYQATPEAKVRQSSVDSARRVPHSATLHRHAGSTLTFGRRRTMGMVSEFKAFAMKGNLIDMAVGIVIGAAFGTVVSSFIDGVFMPAISPVMGGVDLASLTYEMSPAVMEGGEVVKEAVVINVGGFLSALVSFIIVAFVMFLIIKNMNKAMEAMKKEEAAAPAPAAPPADVVLLTEIRDLLAKS